MILNYLAENCKHAGCISAKKDKLRDSDGSEFASDLDFETAVSEGRLLDHRIAQRIEVFTIIHQRRWSDEPVKWVNSPGFAQACAPNCVIAHSRSSHDRRRDRFAAIRQVLLPGSLLAQILR
jgi:hypothetical protein